MVHEDNPPVTSVCFAPNGRYVLAFSMDSCIRLWDYVSGSVKKTYQGHRNGGYSIGGCFSVVGGRPFVTAASEDGDIVLWDVRTKEIAQRIERAHESVVFWVDVHGDTLVSCGQDGKIRIFQHQGPEDGDDDDDEKKIEEATADGPGDVVMADADATEGVLPNGNEGMSQSQTPAPVVIKNEE